MISDADSIKKYVLDLDSEVSNWKSKFKIGEIISKPVFGESDHGVFLSFLKLSLVFAGFSRVVLGFPLVFHSFS